MLWCCTQRTCVSGAVTAFTRVLSAPRNIRKLAISVPAARWINAPSAPAALTLTAARKNLKSTAITVWRKASCRCAQKCARPNRYSPAIAMSSPRSTRSAYRSVATAPVLGVGKLPTKNRLRRDVSHTVQHLKTIEGRGTIPDVRSYVLEHPVGRNWQEFHNVTLRWIGGIAIFGMLAILLIFYLSRGMVMIKSGRSGRKIVRFNAFERFVHWMTATCFIILGISGLNITFGKPLLLPLIGPEAFTTWSELAKYAHNFLSFPFTIGVVLIFLMWIGGNIPNAVDVEWFKRGGGIIGDDHPPADRFNGGQKAIYWIVVLGGSGVAITGYALMFPFYGTDIDTMQYAQMVHAVVA